MEPDMSFPAAFTRLAWSNLAAQSAEQIGLAAAPIVAVLALGAGEAATGLLQTAQTLPFLVLALPAGVLADRIARRRLMAAAEALRAFALVTILTLFVLGALSWPVLAMLGFAGACGTVAYMVAAPAMVPALVPRAALVAANGRIELARTTAFVAGPALAGALVGWAGATPAFALAVALSSAAVVLLIGIHEPPRAKLPPRHPLHDLREGAAFVLRHRLLLPILLTQFIFNGAFFVLQAVYVPYAVHHLGLSASQVGATLATYGVGMVAGVLLAPRIARHVRLGTMIAIGPICGVLAAFVMVATIWLPTVALAAASFFLVGVGPMLWVISTTTLRQTVTPPELLGRVSAIAAMATGARTIGAAIGALVGGLYGAEACLVVAALLFVVQAAVILASPVVGLVREPASA
jgi:predicted MFS family arabinose efflux permease